MPPQRMPLRKPRMIEIFPWIMRHPDPLHHPPRPHIPRHRERNQPIQPQHIKRIPSRNPRRLSCQPLAPVLGRQTPANLNRRRERRLELRNHQPHKADEIARLNQFRRIRTKAVPVKVALDAPNQCIGFLRRQQARKKLHHPRVCVHPLKRQPIFRAPSSQNQPLRLEPSVHSVNLDEDVGLASRKHRRNDALRC